MVATKIDEEALQLSKDVTEEIIEKAKNHLMEIGGNGRSVSILTEVIQISCSDIAGESDFRFSLSKQATLLKLLLERKTRRGGLRLPKTWEFLGKWCLL